MHRVWSLIQGPAFALAMTMGAAAAPSGTVVVYTSQPSDQIAKVVDAFRKTHPAVKIELFRSGTTEVLNKLQAEFAAGRPQADVVLIADAVAMTQLKDDGRLMSYPDAPAGKVPAALVDPDKTFFGTKLITTGIVINTKLVTSPPRSWKDLLPPAAAGKTILAHPLYSGAAVIHIGTMVQQPEFGWGYFETLAKNGAIAGQAATAPSSRRWRAAKRPTASSSNTWRSTPRTRGRPWTSFFRRRACRPSRSRLRFSRPAATSRPRRLSSTGSCRRRRSASRWRKAISRSLPISRRPKGYPPLSSLKIMPSDLKAILAKDEENKRRFLELFGG